VGDGRFSLDRSFKAEFTDTNVEFCANRVIRPRPFDSTAADVIRSGWKLFP